MDYLVVSLLAMTEGVLESEKVWYMPPAIY
jgi:hypothetical protein